MPLDRKSIEKKDFPVGRRGYSPEAVHAHLSSLADEVAELKRSSADQVAKLKRSSRSGSETLAATASERVRSIIEAAESSAAAIQRGAENDARQVRQAAESEAKATRELAAEQAREDVDKVSASADTMVERLNAMESQLSTLIESLRAGCEAFSGELKLLAKDLTEIPKAIVMTAYPGAPTAHPDPAEPVSAETGDEPAKPEADRNPPAGTETEVETDHGDANVNRGDGNANRGDANVNRGDANANRDDAEGVRLIALNMALSGRPRGETARYLTEHFSLPDTDGLLDEVYASVES